MKIYPSSYEPIVEGTTDPEYPQGCLRYQVIIAPRIRDEWPRQEIDPLYSAIGRIAEEQVLSSLPVMPDIQREVALSLDLGNGVTISGRVDILTPVSIIEVKATLGATKRAMWRKGTPDPHHEGQLLTYMALLQRPQGILYARYVHFSKDSTKLEFEQFTWTYELTPTEAWARVSEFYDTLIHWNSSSELPTRPLSDSPCFKCPFIDVCSSSTKGREEFTRQVEHRIREGAPSVVGVVPRIKAHDRKSK